MYRSNDWKSQGTYLYQQLYTLAYSSWSCEAKTVRSLQPAPVSSQCAPIPKALPVNVEDASLKVNMGLSGFIWGLELKVPLL